MTFFPSRPRGLETHRVVGSLEWFRKSSFSFFLDLELLINRSLYAHSFDKVGYSLWRADFE